MKHTFDITRNGVTIKPTDHRRVSAINSARLYSILILFTTFDRCRLHLLKSNAVACGFSALVGDFEKMSDFRWKYCKGRLYGHFFLFNEVFIILYWAPYTIINLLWHC